MNWGIVVEWHLAHVIHVLLVHLPNVDKQASEKQEEYQKCDHRKKLYSDDGFHIVFDKFQHGVLIFCGFLLKLYIGAQPLEVGNDGDHFGIGFSDNVIFGKACHNLLLLCHNILIGN